MMFGERRVGHQQDSVLRLVAAGSVAGMIVLGALSGWAADDAVSDQSLGRPGYLVIEAGRDTTAGYRWERGLGSGFHSLVWDQGRLTLPDSLRPEEIGLRDVGVPCTAQLEGTGASGRLMLQDGIYPVSEPLVMKDGRLELHLTGGELEIRGARIRYRQPSGGNRDFKAGLLMLAGMTVLVLVLLRRARLKAEERSGS